MKCSKCGGDNPANAKFCQFCSGTSFIAVPAAGTPPMLQAQPLPQAATADHITAAVNANVPGFMDNVLRIKSLPVNSFRWLPFLFTVCYLAGRGNTKEAVRTAGILLGGSALAAIFAILGLRGVIPLITIATYIFNIYYAYLLATRADSLVQRNTPFNWGLCLGYGFVFTILSILLSTISSGPRYWGM